MIAAQADGTVAKHFSSRVIFKLFNALCLIGKALAKRMWFVPERLASKLKSEGYNPSLTFGHEAKRSSQFLP